MRTDSSHARFKKMLKKIPRREKTFHQVRQQSNTAESGERYQTHRALYVQNLCKAGNKLFSYGLLFVRHPCPNDRQYIISATQNHSATAYPLGRKLKYIGRICYALPCAKIKLKRFSNFSCENNDIIMRHPLSTFRKCSKFSDFSVRRHPTSAPQYHT